MAKIIAAILRLRAKNRFSENCSGQMPAVVGGRIWVDKVFVLFSQLLESEDYPIAVCPVKMMQTYFPTWYYRRIFNFVFVIENIVVMRLIAGFLFGIWVVLVLLGKGGFVHLLLLSGIGVGMVEIMTVYRTHMTR